MNGQNGEMALSKDENWNYVQAQEHKDMAHKVADKLVQNDGRLDTATTKGNDLIFYNNILPLTTTVRESINIEEEEVLKMIQECLDLRKKYVFRETIAPWMKRSDQNSNIKDDPFHFVPVEATAVSFLFYQLIGHD